MAGIHERVWINVIGSHDEDKDFDFSLCSYNILAQKYISREVYPYCSKTALKKKSRNDKIIEELMTLEMDIYCLQELENDDELLIKIDAMGYDGVFKEKAKFTMENGKENTRLFGEGCGIFWKKNKFKLLKSHVLYMQKLSEGRSDYYDIVELDRNQVAVMVALAAIGSPNDTRQTRPLIVSTTHLYWHPHFMYTKCHQWLKTYMESIMFRREIAMDIRPHYPYIQEYDIPLILCGDFNTETNNVIFNMFSAHEPEYIVPHLEEFHTPDSIFDQRRDTFLRAQKGEEVFPEAFSSEEERAKKNAERDREVLNMINTIYQMPRLISIYPVRFCKYTTFTNEFTGVLDHILISEGSDVVNMEFLAIPEISIAREQTALPNDYHGSDHVPIAGTFRMNRLL